VKGKTMLDKARLAPAEQIGAVVGEILARRGLDGPVAADADLARFGMTSIDMVELMLGVEAEFDLTIPPAEITLRNFGSIAAIEAMVSRLRPPS